MKLRGLKHRFEGFYDHMRAWPPIWVPGGRGACDAFAADGVPESVSVRRPLSWDSPPSLTDVEQVLRAHPGNTIRDIGELDVY